MEPLEQVTVVITLMQRLVQVFDHERMALESMRLDALPHIQDEKTALAEAYEIELDRLRRAPEKLAALEPGVRDRLHEEMRAFQEAVTANLNALTASQNAVEKVLQNIGESLARSTRDVGYGAGARSSATPWGEVIAVAFDRQA